MDAERIKIKEKFDELLKSKNNINRKFGNDYRIVKYTNDSRFLLLVDNKGYYIYKVNPNFDNYTFIDYGSELTCMESLCDIIIEHYT
jgi:hypothetical protein